MKGHICPPAAPKNTADVKVKWFRRPRPFYVSGQKDPLWDTVGEVSINDTKVISIFLDSKLPQEDVFENEDHLDSELGKEEMRKPPEGQEYFARLDAQGFRSLVGTSDTKEGIEAMAKKSAYRFWSLVSKLTKGPK